MPGTEYLFQILRVLTAFHHLDGCLPLALGLLRMIAFLAVVAPVPTHLSRLLYISLRLDLYPLVLQFLDLLLHSNDVITNFLDLFAFYDWDLLFFFRFFL